jgi:hypothetical protein
VIAWNRIAPKNTFSAEMEGQGYGSIYEDHDESIWEDEEGAAYDGGVSPRPVPKPVSTSNQTLRIVS